LQPENPLVRVRAGRIVAIRALLALFVCASYMSAAVTVHMMLMPAVTNVIGPVTVTSSVGAPIALDALAFVAVPATTAATNAHASAHFQIRCMNDLA
jgi:hypothetical protein